MNAYEIPLTPASQTFQTTIMGASYTLTVTWRQAAGLWFLDIADSSNNPLVNGVAMVTGVDLLGQYAFLNFVFKLYVISDVTPDALPTYDNLGIGSHLYVATP